MADFAAWFRREDYERIREIMEDSDRLPPSFDEWQLLAKSRVAKAKRDGIIRNKSPLTSVSASRIEQLPGQIRKE
jgi:hypothetical protein